MSDRITTAEVTLEETGRFLDFLRTRDWKIGIDQYLSVYRTYLAIAPSRPPTPARVKAWLASLLAHDAREQRALGILFDDWLAADRRSERKPVPPVGARSLPPPPSRRERNSLLVSGIVTIVVMAAIIATLFWLWAPSQPPNAHPLKPLETDPQAQLLRLFLMIVIAVPALTWTALSLYRYGARRQLRSAYGDATRFEEYLLMVSATAVEAKRGPAAAWRELRVRRSIGVYDLDVRRTVDATVRSGGYFDPRYRARRRTPEYVMLIDRLSAADHLSAVSQSIVAQFEEGEIPLMTYTFHSDPRVCWRPGKPEEVFSLSAIAAIHRDDRLVLLTDGEGLIDPYLGTPYRWVEWFKVWDERAIVTPVPRHNRGAREDALKDLFPFVTATETALESLAAVFDESRKHAKQQDDDENVASVPQAIERDPRPWLDREAPEPREIAWMTAQLRRTLGVNGFRWLCGCAVYPALEPRLTRYVGTALGIDYWPLFMALSRLPWFRTGRMPDWVRLRLIGELGTTDEKQVRDALRALIDTCRNTAVPDYSLSISAAVPWLTRLLQRMHLRDVSKSVPIGSALRDRVFLDFMNERKPDRLGFEVREFVAAMLRRKKDREAAAPRIEQRPAVERPFTPLPGQQQKVMLALSYLGILALIPRIVGKADREVRWHSSQGLATWILLTAYWIAQIVIGFALRTVFPYMSCFFTVISCVVWLFVFCSCLMATVYAVTGRRLRIPFTARMASYLGAPAADATTISADGIAAPRIPATAAAFAIVAAAALMEWIHGAVLIGHPKDSFGDSLSAHRLFAVASLLATLFVGKISDRLNAHRWAAVAGVLMTICGSVSLLGSGTFAQFFGITLVAVGCACTRPCLAAYLGDRFGTGKTAAFKYVLYAAVLVIANNIGMASADNIEQGASALLAGSFAVILLFIAGVVSGPSAPLSETSLFVTTRDVDRVGLALSALGFTTAIAICRDLGFASYVEEANVLPLALRPLLFAALLAGVAFLALRFIHSHPATPLMGGAAFRTYTIAAAIIAVAAGFAFLLAYAASIVPGILVILLLPTAIAEVMGSSSIMLTLARITERQNRAFTLALWFAAGDAAALIAFEMWTPVAILLLVTFAGMIAFARVTVSSHAAREEVV